MIDTLYGLLAKVNYTHPIHPPFTHGPIGAVMVAFCIAVFGLLWRRQYVSSVYHSLIVALALLLPTALAGILDWQHYYAGAWAFPIRMKIALTLLLFVLLSTTLLVGRKPDTHPLMMPLLFTLCLFNVMGLGYFGGQLVYAGRNPAVEEKLQVGQKIFVSHCSGCHANGGNIFFPNLPLRSAPQLASYDSFIDFVRNPRLPDGLKGPMPAFTEKKLSDLQAHELYLYIVEALAKTSRTESKEAAMK